MVNSISKKSTTVNPMNSENKIMLSKDENKIKKLLLELHSERENEIKKGNIRVKSGVYLEKKEELQSLMGKILEKNPNVSKGRKKITDITTAQRMLKRDRSNFNSLSKDVILDPNLWSWMADQNFFEDISFIQAYCFRHVQIADKVLSMLESELEKNKDSYDLMFDIAHLSRFKDLYEDKDFDGMKESLKQGIDKFSSKQAKDFLKIVLNNFKEVLQNDIKERGERFPAAVYFSRLQLESAEKYEARLLANPLKTMQGILNFALKMKRFDEHA